MSPNQSNQNGLLMHEHIVCITGVKMSLREAQGETKIGRERDG